LRAQVAFALSQFLEHGVDAVRRPLAGARDSGQVFVHRERLEDIALLRHPADAGGSTFVRGQRVQGAAGQHDAAAMLARSTCQRVDQGGLAGAVTPKQG